MVFSTNDVATMGYSNAKKFLYLLLYPYLLPCTKIIAKYVTDLKVKLKIIKLLEENLCDFVLGNSFLDMTPKMHAKTISK